MGRDVSKCLVTFWPSQFFRFLGEVKALDYKKFEGLE